jgi:hypothetical protein
MRQRRYSGLRGAVVIASRQDCAMLAGGTLRRVLLLGHSHDRNRSFDLSPCLAALVWT